MGSSIILCGHGRHVAGVRRGIDVEIRITPDPDAGKLVTDVFFRRGNRLIAPLEAAYSGLLKGDSYRSLVGGKFLTTGRYPVERITDPHVWGVDRRCAAVRWRGFVGFVQRPCRSSSAS